MTSQIIVVLILVLLINLITTLSYSVNRLLTPGGIGSIQPGSYTLEVRKGYGAGSAIRTGSLNEMSDVS